MSERLKCLIVFTMTVLAPATGRAAPLLSEVLYDAVGADAGGVFVEVSGAPGTDLSGFVLEGINGANGSITESVALAGTCLLYTSPSPRDKRQSRMPSSA